MPSDYFVLGGRPVLRLSPLMIECLPAGSGNVAHFEVDWEQVARSVGLSRAEAAVFMRVYRDEQPASSLSAELGISRRGVDKTLGSVREKLQDARAEVLQCFLSIIPESEQIIARERNYICLVSQQHTDNFVQMRPVLGRISRRTNVKMKQLSLSDLDANLCGERRKFDTVLVKSQAAEQGTWQAEQRLADLQTGETADAATAILEGRDVDKTFPKRIAAAATEYAASVKNRDAHRAALDQQRAVVASLESEIHSRRMEALQLDLARPAKDLRKALELLADASSACSEVFRTHTARGTEFNLFNVLFPPAAPQHPEDDFFGRRLALNAYLAALQVAARQGWSVLQKSA